TDQPLQMNRKLLHFTVCIIQRRERHAVISLRPFRRGKVRAMRRAHGTIGEAGPVPAVCSLPDLLDRSVREQRFVPAPTHLYVKAIHLFKMRLSRHNCPVPLLLQQTGEVWEMMMPAHSVLRAAMNRSVQAGKQTASCGGTYGGGSMRLLK